MTRAALAFLLFATRAIAAPQGSNETREVTLDARDRLDRAVPGVIACVPEKTQCLAVPVRAEGGTWIVTLPPGSGTLRLEALGFNSKDIDLPPDATTSTVRLVSAGSMTVNLTSFDPHREQGITAVLYPGEAKASASAKALDEKKLGIPPKPRKGALTMDDLPPGTYTLVWSGPLVARETREFPIDAKGGRAQLGEFELTAGLTIDGAVRDTAGSPIGGARVSVVHCDRDELPKRSVRTGPDGRFEIVGIPLGARLLWRASLEGYEWTGGLWAGETRLEISLESAQRVSGTVLDDRGEPVRGAHVELAIQGPQGGGLGISWKTDASGRFSGFRPERAPNFEHQLEVTAEGWLLKAVDLPQGRLPKELDLGEIRLEKGLAIRGHITEGASGGPVQGARIVVHVVDKSESGGRIRPPSVSRSRSDGSFEVSGLPESEEYVAEGSKEGWARASKSVRDAKQRVELVLTKGGTFAGRFCGTPRGIEETRVLAMRMLPGLALPPEKRLGAGGEFVMEMLEPGDYEVGTLWVHPNGHPRVLGETIVPVTVHEGQTTEVSLECDGIQVSGIVLLDGKPLPNADGSFAKDGGWTMNLRTDAAGAFSVRVKTPGTYSVSLASGVSAPPDGMLLSSSACEVPAGGTSCTVMLTLTPETPRPEG